MDDGIDLKDVKRQKRRESDRAALLKESKQWVNKATLLYLAHIIKLGIRPDKRERRDIAKAVRAYLDHFVGD